MKSRFLKAISLVLTIALMLSAIPFSINASTLVASNSSSDATQLIDDNPDVQKELREKRGLGVVEIESMREENVKHFQLEDGTYQAISYGAPIHRLGTDGAWTEIDNRLISSRAESVATGDSFFTFANNSTSETLFTLDDGKYSISFGLNFPQAKSAEIKIDNHLQISKNLDQLNGNEKLNALKEVDTTTKVFYKNVLDGINLEYILDGNNVKENMILEKYTGITSFSYYMTLENLYIKTDESGAILFVNKDGKQQYFLSVPFMYDAKGAISYDVKYTLKEIGKFKYELTVSADESWLASTERAYPVVIDPSVNSSSTYFDTFIYSAAPSTNYGSGAELWVGNGMISLLKMNMPSLPSYANITYASLTARYHYNVSSGSLDIGVYPCVQNWGEYSWTWNSAAAYSNMGLSTTRKALVTASAASSINASNPGFLSFPLTELVKEWYSGTTNYGIGLKYEGGTNSSIILESYEASSAYRAYYTINYSIITPDISNGEYFIKSADTAKFVDIENQVMANGTNIHQWEYHGGQTQKWKFTYLHNGYYSIKSMNGAYYLGVANDSTGNDAQVVLRTVHNTSGTQWKISKTASGSYKITPKSGEPNNRVLAVGWYLANTNGIDIQQRDYVKDSNLKDEWYITKVLNIGLSTDNYTAGCNYRTVQAYTYATDFCNDLQASPYIKPMEIEHHYNKDAVKSASKLDFSVDGAFSNNIDFMIYMGHGLKGTDGRGNCLHYNCASNGTTHTSDCTNSIYNAYHSEIQFGSSSSKLRWAWLYTCNFLTTTTYVTDTSLKSMMNGAHIVMGYGSQAYLCRNMVKKFASCLLNGDTIIDSFFAAGVQEANTAKSNNSTIVDLVQKVMYINETRNETIFAEPVNYLYTSSDVLIMTRTYAVSSNQ